MRRTNLREQVYGDIARGDITYDPNNETALDRIAALGMIDPLGAALWRVLGQHDSHAFRAAARLLHDRLHWPVGIDRETRARSCLISIEEFVSKLCDTCGGRKFQTTESGVRIECQSCHGTGIGSKSHEDRLGRLGVGKGVYAQLVVVFDEAHRLLNNADSFVSYQLAYRIGRRDGWKRRKQSSRRQSSECTRVLP